MDLENFVAQTLVQITKGIQKAQKEVETTGAWINPSGHGLPRAEQIELSRGIHAFIHNVEFDVAVTVGNNQSAEGGAKLNVLSVKIGASGAVSYENEQVSRVSFSVPVVWPQITREDREHAKAAQRLAEAAEMQRHTEEQVSDFYSRQP